MNWAIRLNTGLNFKGIAKDMLITDINTAGSFLGRISRKFSNLFEDRPLYYDTGIDGIRLY